MVYVNCWTPEKIEKLRILINLKWSGSQIGAALGVSRNSVLGKADRLGWSLKSRGRPPKKSYRPLGQKLTLTMWGNRNFARSTPLPVLPPAKPPVGSIEPEPLHIGIFELTHEHCRWPIGDRAPLTYCGHPRSRTSNLWFCDYHVKAAAT